MPKKWLLQCPEAGRTIEPTSKPGGLPMAPDPDDTGIRLSDSLGLVDEGL